MHTFNDLGVGIGSVSECNVNIARLYRLKLLRAMIQLVLLDLSIGKLVRSAVLLPQAAIQGIPDREVSITISTPM